MAIKINDDSMRVEVDESVIATATRISDGWIVSTWPGVLTRNQAITALMIAEYVATDHGEDDPFVVAGRAELPRG
jgi:hypothetical protein